MKKKNLIAMCIIALGTTTLLNSCGGDIVTLSDSSADETQASSISDEIVNVTDELLDSIGVVGYQGAKSSTNTGKPTITLTIPVVPYVNDSIVYPNTITIDLGTEGYIGKRGNTLKGKIKIIVNKAFTEEGAIRTFTLEDFSVNGNSVKGHKIVTYKGKNSDDQPYWTIDTKDTIELATGETITNAGIRTRTRTSNNGTPRILSDDSYSITGESGGENAKGRIYAVTINDAKPLILELPDPHFVKGEVTLVSGLKKIKVDYGDGTHDNKATATFKDEIKEITLR